MKIVSLGEDRLREAIRREAFVHGFIAANNPTSASATLMLLPEADAAYVAWRATR